MSFILPDHEVTKQELLDCLSDLYAAWYFHGGETNVQFDCMDAAGLIMQRARRDGLRLKCLDLKSPEPPKPDLPLFDALA